MIELPVPDCTCITGDSAWSEQAVRAILAAQVEKDAKDANRWRYWAANLIDFVWSPAEGKVKWVRYVDMPEPDISADGMKAKGGAVKQLEAFIDSQVR